MNNPDTELAISCKNLTKEYHIIDDKLNWRLVFSKKTVMNNAFKALNEISLSIPKGKFAAILGRNGAGKTTFLRVLGGVYQPDSGIVNLTGKPGALYEMGGFGSKMLTGAAYARRFLELNEISHKDRAKIIDNIKEFAELGDYFSKPLYSYSSGMAARLYFATATALEHKIYLVDELLSVGDEYFQAKCWKRLQERFTHGASGILVTHDWSAALKLCETAYIFEKGRVIANGPAAKVVQQYLNLPVPDKVIAEIISEPKGLILESGKDAQLKFSILLKQPIAICLNYSIEVFRSGYGWEIILINQEDIKLNCQPGNNSCIIEIRQLPLVSGEYYLNIFLKALDTSIDSSRLDARSWIYGNGIKILVKGCESVAAVVLPWKKQIRLVDNASNQD